MAFFHNQGVRRRLLMSFFGISAFAVLAAGVAMYSFFEVGNMVNIITERRVPMALASLELSRHVERIAAVAPALLAVETPEEHEEMSRRLNLLVQRLDELFANLKRSEIDADALRVIEHDVSWLRLNLTNLDSLIVSRIASAQFMKEMLSELVSTRTRIDELLLPGGEKMDEQVARLRRQLGDAAPDAGLPMRRATELAEAVALSTLLHDIKAEVRTLEDKLLQASAARDTEKLAGANTLARQSIAILEGLTSGLYIVDREGLAEAIASLKELAIGRGGILSTRAYDVDNLSHAEGLLRDSALASSQLTDAVNELVAGAKNDIVAASRDTSSVQQFSTWVLIAAVALSLVSSTLIVWFYVERNLIARLTALSDGMLAIAGGNLKAELPPSGDKDEIGRMAEALIVFRNTAIEVEEANLREMQETRRRLSDAIETISEGFSLFDAEDRLVLCNSRYRKLLYPGIEDILVPGTPYEDIIRRAAESGLIVDAEGRVDDWVGWRLEQHRNPGPTHVQHRASGHWIQVSERRTESGGIVAVYTDITALKKHEERLAELIQQLEIARDQAMDASRAKSNFLANMSHELRTPLNAILGYTELILDNIYDEVPQKMRGVVERVEQNGRHLLALINDVLDLSKIEAGHFTIALDDYSIEDIVSTVANNFGSLVVEKRISLRTDIQANLPAGRGDERRITQVLMNLVGNAIKFTDEGEVAMSVGAVNGEFIIAVSDTGPGISENDLQRILEQFQQADNTSTRDKDGTGLGLAIAKHMIELHGGRLWIESALGEGSTFSFALPVRVEQRAEVA